MFRDGILSLFFRFASTKMMSSIDYSMVGSEKSIIYITKPNEPPPPPHKNFQGGEFRQAVSQYGVRIY